jgi:hypothetical protein
MADDFKSKLELSGLSVKTQYIYLNEIKKYLKGEDDLEKFKKENVIIGYIEAHYETLNQKNQMTKAVIKWRELNGMKSLVLSKYLSKNVAGYTSSLNTKYETEDNNLPTVKEHETFVNELFEKKKYREYIINRLIEKFQVRNIDLDLTITRNKSDLDDKQNWLLIGKKQKSAFLITYLRNDYKTSDTYGAKKNIIRLGENTKLFQAIDEVSKSGQPKLILEKNLSTAVLKATNGIGEGKLFKIYMKHASFKDAKKMADNRGTDLQTISKFYDIK